MKEMKKIPHGNRSIPVYEVEEDGSEHLMFDIDVITLAQQAEDEARALEAAATLGYFASQHLIAPGEDAAALIAAEEGKPRPLHEAVAAIKYGRATAIPWAPIPMDSAASAPELPW